LEKIKENLPQTSREFSTKTMQPVATRTEGWAERWADTRAEPAGNLLRLLCVSPPFLDWGSVQSANLGTERWG